MIDVYDSEQWRSFPLDPRSVSFAGLLLKLGRTVGVFAELALFIVFFTFLKMYVYDVILNTVHHYSIRYIILTVQAECV